MVREKTIYDEFFTVHPISIVEKESGQTNRSSLLKIEANCPLKPLLQIEHCVLQY